MSQLLGWAAQWGVSMAAVQDLQRRMIMVDVDPPHEKGGSEAAVQVQIRLEASAKGCRLFRNNVGATYDERGNFIRYGLANDSERLNDQIKSADLIGIRPVLITQAHVGGTIGQFLSREVKAAGWKYTATAREQAQLRWAEFVIGLGGDAAFANSTGTI